MNWTVTRSKYIWNNYTIFCGQLLNILFFYQIQKMNLGCTYIYKSIYIYICFMQKLERNHGGHLTFYLLLSGLRNNQNSCFTFLTSRPMYLFVPRTPPPTPRWISGHLGHWTWHNQKEDKLQDSTNELMIIKQKKLHTNWILYFCCCSKQPVHVL